MLLHACVNANIVIVIVIWVTLYFKVSALTVYLPKEILVVYSNYMG